MRKLAVLAALAAAAHTSAFAQAPPGDAARGKPAYMKHGCYACHGTVGQGGDRGSGGRIAYDVWPWEAFARRGAGRGKVPRTRRTPERCRAGGH